jgi:hypothetical protein
MHDTAYYDALSVTNYDEFEYMTEMLIEFVTAWCNDYYISDQSESLHEFFAAELEVALN